MISKELLSEVFEVESIPTNIVDNTLWYDYVFIQNNEDLLDSEIINIYELAHKCKEWAWWKGYNIFIEKHGIGGGINEAHIKGHLASNDGYVGYYPKEDTEPEAIFKACEWIMKNA